MDSVPLLQSLVATPSVNPMGRDVAGPEFLEGRVSDRLVEILSAEGVEHRRIEIVPGRANVLALVPGRSADVLLFDAHQDTVPVDGMTIAPFEPVLDGDRLYGRGACDVKGGMAAMLSAILRLAQGPPPPRTVVLSCTCDEEATTLGANALVASWSSGIADWWARRPAAAIVAEPTELDVVVAHRGVARWKVRTRGRACHSSDPSQGINAIYRMAPVLAALEKYAAALARDTPPHPLCGSATLSVGRIDGGISVNTVPDCCGIEIDRRVLPGEDAREAMEAAEAALRGELGDTFDTLPPWLLAPALPDTHNAELSRQLLATVATTVGPRRALGVPYGTHASRFAAADVPSVVFGPGDIAQAHTKDEWISVTQLRQAAEIYYRFALQEY